MAKKTLALDEFIFRQLIPNDAIGLPLESTEAIERARSTLERLGFDESAIVDLLDWLRELSDTKRRGGMIRGQLRLEEVAGRALMILLSATFSNESSGSWSGNSPYAKSNGANERVGVITSTLDGTDVSIFSDLRLSPKDHVIYDTRTCTIEGLPGGGVAHLRAQTTVLTIGPQLTALFGGWVASCRWLVLDEKTAQ